MSSTQRLLDRTKKLFYICCGVKRFPYICFGGKWRGSETELTDWESIRRLFVVIELVAATPILLFAFWPTALYVLGISMALGCLTVSWIGIYNRFTRPTPEEPEIDEWHEYWKNKTLV